MTTRTQAIAIASAIALSPLSLLPAAVMHHAPIAIEAGSAVGNHVVWVDPATGEAWKSREDCPNTACTATSDWNVKLTAYSCTDTDAYAREVGDDNCDGTIMEDESGWDCATMGNMICGPGQSSPNADVTYCPSDDTWSATWHSCPALATGPNAWDEGEYVGGYN